MICFCAAHKKVFLRARFASSAAVEQQTVHVWSVQGSSVQKRVPVEKKHTVSITPDTFYVSPPQLTRRASRVFNIFFFPVPFSFQGSRCS